MHVVRYFCSTEWRTAVHEGLSNWRLCKLRNVSENSSTYKQKETFKNTVNSIFLLIFLVFTSKASTSANTVILISPWKKSWRRYKHKRKHRDQKFSFFVLRLCLRLRCNKWKRSTAKAWHKRKNIYLTFGEWKYLIQITSRLKSLEGSDDFACACVESVSWFSLTKHGIPVTCRCVCACDCVVSESLANRLLVRVLN